MTEALYYQALEGNKVNCLLCPHLCIIADGQQGKCKVRVNSGGKMLAGGYGLVSSCAIDPIEKKPLYHFKPGKMILSIGGYGCNFKCSFCQNHSISMMSPIDGHRVSPPSQLAALAKEHAPQGNIGVAYTYNEPLINYEYVYDCALKVKDAGLCNVLVTNGFINPDPFERLLPLIDALNIDLKGFTQGFYDKVGGNLDNVREIIKMAAKNAHVEITTLVIPDENDSDEEISALSEFLASVDKKTPFHLSRFFPKHLMTNKPPTPKDTLFRLRDVAKAHLENVYLGNV